MRFLPLLLQILFAGTALVWRAWYQRRTFGTAGVVLFRGDWRQHLRDGGLLVLLVGLGAQGVAAAVAPEALARWRFGGGWESPVVAWVGAAVVAAATGLMVASQLHLGRSWRIGIEEHARPGLVTGGFYRFCRNPIFAFLLLAVFGMLLLLPTWVSVALFVGAYVGVRAQVAAEEAWLGRAYGDSYLEYARRVGRFLPWVGRRT